MVEVSTPLAAGNRAVRLTRQAGSLGTFRAGAPGQECPSSIAANGRAISIEACP